jgi:hypothetical protein
MALVLLLIAGAIAEAVGYTGLFQFVLRSDQTISNGAGLNASCGHRRDLSV